MDFGYTPRERGGYDEHPDRPPRSVLSNDTIRNALARAASANSSHSSSSSNNSNSSSSSASLHRTSSSHSNYSRTATNSHTSYSSHHPDSIRTSSSNSSRSRPKQKDCECLDCRDLTYRKKQGSTRFDHEGNMVHEHNSGQAPRLHVHVQAGMWDEDEKPRPLFLSRKSHNTSYESRNIMRNSDGDLIEEWHGSEAPPVRAHYLWDE